MFLTLRGLIWKVKLPLKILTFIWKLLHDSLPVFEVLNNRGITVSSKCLICNEDEESINHLIHALSICKSYLAWIQFGN